MVTIVLFLEEPNRLESKVHLKSAFLYSHNILLYEDGHAVVADFGGEISVNSTSNDITFFLPSLCLILYDKYENRFHRTSCSAMSFKFL